MYLDLFLIAVMLVSGLLAMVRGFMREVLSIAAWGLAAIATLYSYSKLLPYAKQYFNNDYVAAGVTIGGVFLLTLIVASVLTVRISDRILDSRIGALDRTLGFLFGLARGLLIVVVAFVFFDWLVPAKSQPEMIRNARSRVVLKGTGDWLISLLPEDPENTILKRFKKRPADEAEPQESPSRRSALGPVARYASWSQHGIPVLVRVPDRPIDGHDGAGV
jgi:membrane protein required for colicin V production